MSGLSFRAARGALPLAFIRLRAPTGAHPIGTLNGLLAGAIPVQLWYPAELTFGARRAAYRSEVKVQQRSFRRRLMYPFVCPSAYLDVPVAAGRHAVVLYVPGWGEKRSDNTALCEDLASQGFVVAAIDDQRPEPALDFSSRQALKTTLRAADTKVRLQSLELSTVLTALQCAAPPHPAYKVASRMDFGRVAAVGFSFGGATAAEAALHDARIACAIDLDGWTFGDAAQSGVSKPFMVVSTGAATIDPPAKNIPRGRQMGPYEMEFDQKNMRQMLDGFERYGGYLLSVDGACHESFSDAGLLPLRLRRSRGSIDGRRAAHIVAAYVIEFLACVLDGRHAPLLANHSGATALTSRSSLDRAAEFTTWMSPSATRGKGTSSEPLANG